MLIIKKVLNRLKFFSGLNFQMSLERCIRHTETRSVEKS